MGVTWQGGRSGAQEDDGGRSSGGGGVEQGERQKSFGHKEALGRGVGEGVLVVEEGVMVAGG